MARSIGIRIHKGSDLIETQVFERDIIKIGRLASAHLRLEDPKVSRIHAVIDIANGSEVSIIDMGSAEGTRVNGEKVSRVRLNHGDEVGLGDSRLVIVLDEAELAQMKGGAAAAPAPAAAAAVTAPPASAPFEGGLSAQTGVFTSGPTDVSALRAELAASVPPTTTHSEVFDVAASFDAPKTSPLQTAAPMPEAVPPPAPPVVTPPPAAVAQPAVVSQPPAVAPAVAPPAPPPVAARPSVPPPRPAPAPRAAEPPPPQMVFAPPMVGMPPLPPIPEDRITPENRFIEVTVRWGSDVVECRRVRGVEAFTMGRGDDDDIFMPLEGVASGPSFVLLRSDKGGGWYVRYTQQMAGSVSRGDQNRPLSQAGGSPEGDGLAMPITDDTVVNMTIGQFEIEVRPVAKSRIIPIAPIFDVLWANTALVTMFATTAMLAVVTLMPVGLDSMEDDLLTNPSKFQTLILKPPPKDNSFLKALKGPKEQKLAAKNEQGKAGDKKAKPTETGRMAVKAEKPTDEQVVASKLNALFGDKGSGGIAQLFGEQTGGELEAALGGIDGGKVAAGYGAGGLGLRGGGPGGGGTGINTLGTGKIGTRGRGSGEAGYGSGEGGLGNKSDRDVTMTTGTPVIMGSLDKEIIRRIVQEHASQIRYCYEKELTRTPGIFGKIVMKWVINGEGKVTQAQTAETQMRNANVEGCLATKIKTWVFPKPKGGGIVIVNYPFVFKQSG
jgi:FHA domain